MGIRDEGQESHDETQSIVRDIRHQAHFLPDQGPISTFIHHNTLHSFEHLEFHDALNEAGRVFQSKGYLSHRFFLDKFESGEINDADLREALEIRPLLPEGMIGNIDISLLRRGFLFAEAPEIAPLSRQWFLTKGPKASKKQWTLFQEISRLDWSSFIQPAETLAKTPLIGLVGQVVGGLMVQDVRRAIAQLAGSFLDRGAVIHSLPGRSLGFFHFSLTILAQAPHVDPWLVEVGRQARLSLENGESPVSLIERILEWQQPDSRFHEDLIQKSLLAHPGWAGMFWRLDRYPSERPEENLPVHIEDYLAIQLLLEREICLERSAERFGLEAIFQPGILRKKLTERLLEPGKVPPLPQQAWALLFAMDHEDIPASNISLLSPKGKEELVQASTVLAGNGKLSIWQEAFEASYRRPILRALAERTHKPVANPTPKIQLITCIDDREESFRRALEELEPAVETFGAAGFFGIPVQFTPLGHSRPLDLCPVNVKAVHRVRETPACQPSGARYLRNQQFSRVMKRMEMASRVGVSGSLFGGLLGLIIYPAMVLGLWFPRLGEKIGSIPARMARGGIKTKLEFEEDPFGIGAFPLSDQVARLAGLLENAGLTRNFAPLVILMGHGSTSVNNPHKSAYDCGACGGNEGAASARIFANLINRPDVRKGLAGKGIVIPDSTVFVGCLHDTANDLVTFHDVDVSPGVSPLLEEAQKLFRMASRENARERCRRLHSAPRFPNPGEALRHVQGRSSDLGQPRPELGHATNSLTIIGRRNLSRGLFLDRRAFLISYDPTIDPKGLILERMIAAVGPVVAGISLEYYFSRVDNNVFGCGTKLPQNPVGLLGVQEGAAGDLRTGLPSQMIEIHPPLRLTILLETTRENFTGILERQAEVSRLVNNGWVRIVIVLPDRTAAWLYLPSRGFREISTWETLEGTPPATIHRSPEWFLGKMGDLLPAMVEQTTNQNKKSLAGGYPS